MTITRRYQRSLSRQRSGVVACDTFQRANSSTLGSTNQLPYLPGRPGFAWTEEAGDWEINGNRIGSVGSSPGGLGWLCKCDPGIADLQLEALYPQNPDATTHRLRFRIQDATNWLCLLFLQSNIQFADCVAGTITARGSASTGVAIQAGDIVCVRAVGSALTGWVRRNGAVLGTAATATITNFQTATGVGFRAAAAGDRWTNLLVQRVYA